MAKDDHQAVEEARKFLSSMTHEQSVAVNHDGNPHLLLAGAGAGKTRTLVGRLIKLILPEKYGGFGADPDSIMLVTFTNKAAREIKERVGPVLEGLREARVIGFGDPWIGTFHSLSLRILRQEGLKRGEQMFSIYDDSDAKHLAKEAFEIAEIEQYELPEFFNLLSLAKSNLMTPNFLDDHIDEQTKTGHVIRQFFDEDFIRTYRIYQSLLADQNAVDFSDLLNRTTNLIRSDGLSREAWQSTFRHFLVDEIQDIDRAQIGWLRALSGAGEKITLEDKEREFGAADFETTPINGSGINWRRLRDFPKPSLLFVGDDDQAIYGFRGSDSKMLKLIEKRFPGTFVSFLTLSHRCQPNILDATNALVSLNSGRYDKALHAPEDKPRGSGVSLKRYPSCVNEIDNIITCVKDDIAAGRPLAESAVLVRTRNLARDIAKALRGAGIPVSEGRSSDLRNSAEVKDVMAFASVLENDSAEVHLRRIINKPARGMGATSMAGLIRNAKLKQVSMADELRTIMNDRIEVPDAGTSYKKAFISACKNFGRIIVEARKASDQSENAGDALLSVLTITGYKQDLYDDALKASGITQDRVPKGLDHPREFLAWLVKASSAEKNRSHKTDIGSVEHDELLERGQAISKACGCIANVAVLVEQAAKHERLREFLEDAALDMSHEETREGLVVMTMHAAKGLEFDRVFLPFWLEGIMPHANAMGENTGSLSGGSLEEERRLAYVSMTRARHECFISFGRPDMSAYPGMYGVREAEMSRFIHELQERAPEAVKDDIPQRRVPQGQQRKTSEYNNFYSFFQQNKARSKETKPDDASCERSDTEKDDHPCPHP